MTFGPISGFDPNITQIASQFLIGGDQGGQQLPDIGSNFLEGFAADFLSPDMLGSGGGMDLVQGFLGGDGGFNLPFDPSQITTIFGGQDNSPTLIKGGKLLGGSSLNFDSVTSFLGDGALDNISFSADDILSSGVGSFLGGGSIGGGGIKGALVNTGIKMAMSGGV